MDDFTYVEHTLVVSDIHLADAEKPRPKNPLWKRFKLPEHFIDESFKRFLFSMQNKIRSELKSQAPIELVLNGDIFDFDSVMTLPGDHTYKISSLERLRGLASEEAKSQFKMKVIMDTHPVWMEAIRDFVKAGNRLVFVIGNHDLELHWPTVQQNILDHLQLTDAERERVRFCEWFYISNQDTLIEHGNQYDAYCLSSNPIHPLIKKGSKILVRLPFGNLAGRYMINGMGLMNPHATGTYIKTSSWEYIQFYFKYVVRTEPLLVWSWLWSAFLTFITSVTEGLLPAMRDPLTVNVRLEEIAKKANASVLMVLSLKEVHAHPAIFNPIKIIRELWLDRVLLLTFIVFGSFQLFSFLNVLIPLSLWWSLIPAILCLPLFISYARSVQSEVDALQMVAYDMVSLSAKIARVKRVVQGHIHIENHTEVDHIEVINTGTWSPAYHDVECTQPFGRKCFAWIKPKLHETTQSEGEKTSDRVAELYEWTGNRAGLIPQKIPEQLTSKSSQQTII